MGEPIRSLVVTSLLVLVWVGGASIASPGTADLMFRASTLIVLAISWNLMANAGLISLAQASFSGIGGYTAAILASAFGWPLIAVLPFAICSGALLGVFLAATTARLTGLFFAIASLAASEGLRVIALMVPALTGGAQGIDVPQAVRYSLHTVSIAAAAVAGLALIISVLLSFSEFHYACRAMRNGESAAQMLGLDPRSYRLRALALSGAMAGCMGALTAWYSGFLDPRIAFSLHVTLIAQIAPILGGIYTIVGPVIGALVLTAITEVTRIGFTSNEAFGQLLYGALLVICVLQMPRGIVGLSQSLVNTYRRDWRVKSGVQTVRADPKS